MSEKNYFENRQSQICETEELSAENILSEATMSKVKNRKTKLFQKIMSIRTNFLMNNNINKTQKKFSLEQIFNNIKNINDKIYIINNIFINNIQKAKEVISKYILKINYDENEINPESDNYTNYLLDFLEDNQQLAKSNIVINKDNINCLINRINNMANEIINYDYNYIMIYVYFSILDENVNKILRQQINHQNLYQLIIKHETCLSYIYLFYIYGFLYYLTNDEIAQYDKLLDAIIIALINKKNCKDDKLLWEIYNLLTYFSGIQKFVEKFYNNHDVIFGKRNFYEKDSITIEKLKIIINIFSNMDNKQIFMFLTKENDITLNIALFWLKFLNDNNHIIKVKDDLNKLNLISLSMKTIKIITSYKDLTFELLENKKFLHLFINSLQNFINLNISNPQLMTVFGNNNLLLVDIENIFLEISINIITNGHNEFVSIFYKNKIHFLLQNTLESYLKNNYIINELLFNNILRIISALFEYEKKLNLNTRVIKTELDNNNLYNVILNIKSNNANNNIYNNCNDFLSIYYNNYNYSNFNN